MNYETDSDIYAIKANLVFGGAFALVVFAAVVCFVLSNSVLPTFNFDDMVGAYLTGIANLVAATWNFVQGLF